MSGGEEAPPAAASAITARDDEAPSRADTPHAPADDAPLRVRGVIETALYCSDLEAAEAFYTGVLNFEVFAKEDGRHLFFRCGDGMLLLFNPGYTATTVSEVGDARMPLHGSDGNGHTAFRAPAGEIERWKERLTAHQVTIESEITWPEGGISIFFRDPAGNVLEFTTPETWGLEH